MNTPSVQSGPETLTTHTIIATPAQLGDHTVQVSNRFISVKDLSEQLRLQSQSESRELYPRLWHQGELVALHAPKSVEKISHLINIAHQASKSDAKMLVVDSERRFINHLSHAGDIPELYLCIPEFDSEHPDRDYADIVLADIEDAITTHGANTIFINSINHIAAASFGRNASVSYLMKKIFALQFRYKVSILVVVHDTTANMANAVSALTDRYISIDDLDQPSPTEEKPVRHTKFYTPAELLQSIASLQHTTPAEHAPQQSDYVESYENSTASLQHTTASESSDNPSDILLNKSLPRWKRRALYRNRLRNRTQSFSADK